MDAPRWQFGLYKDGVLLEVYSTDLSQAVRAEQVEALRRADFLRKDDPLSIYRVERIRSGCCIEEDGVVVFQSRTSIDALLPSIEADAARKLKEFQQKNPDKKYVVIPI